eukprot:TRINITY_DN21570_c0_g1_i1.p1 TRINITY_DN21570_c0_g1~~TRINITY_DN21570_c0_g1_i1.p1  ORF type:complete len:195 (+),score=33.98 TRINITY_DN21570_c0_g1_i1:429-1013(+)
MVAGDGCYCDILACLGWRIIVIDTYDVAVRKDSSLALDMRQKLLAAARQRRETAAYLQEHAELNGAVGKVQLKWLRERLEAAAAAKERVVVLAHASLRPDATYFGDAVCWNCGEVCELLDSFTSDVVAAVITGHDHYGGEAESDAGIYHRVLEAAMEGEVGVATHAVLELQGDTIRLRGRGKIRSWEKTFPSRS